jgi:hypothetical protein
MNIFYLNSRKTTTMRKKMTDEITSYGDVYLEELSKNVEESKDEYSKLLDWTNKISDNNLSLIQEVKDLEIKLENLKAKSNDWITDLKYSNEVRLNLVKENSSLREEIKNLKDDIKYERELRIAGAKYHNG